MEGVENIQKMKLLTLIDSKILKEEMVYLKI